LKRMKRLVLVFMLVAVVTAFPAAALADDEAAEVEETRVCPGCGEVIAASSVFCPSCHRYLPDAKVRTITCPDCGAVVLATYKLCPKCGALLRESVITGEGGESEGIAERKKAPSIKRIGGRFKAGTMTGEGFSSVGGWFTLGSRVTKEVFVGGGFGYQDYPNGTSVPLFLAARAYMASGRFIPLIYGDVGYNIARLKHSWAGATDVSGFMVDFGVGLDVLFVQTFGWTVEGGAKWEVSKEYYRYLLVGGGMTPVSDRSENYIYLQAATGFVF
jgi:predicted RNA-binding Zn-ribbon protein involved in translation (DUF1610 family)